MKIEIITDDDGHECETCGGDWAEGGKVIVDGVEVLDRPAFAHCFDNSNYSPNDLLVMALHQLGHTILVDGNPFSRDMSR